MAKPGPKGRAWTEEDTAIVRRMAMVGIPHATICQVLKTDEETLYKYFRAELDESMVRANTAVANALFKSAMEGNVTAQIFWCKTRLGWREVDRIEHSGTVNVQPVFELTLKEPTQTKVIDVTPSPRDKEKK